MNKSVEIGNNRAAVYRGPPNTKPLRSEMKPFEQLQDAMINGSQADIRPYVQNDLDDQLSKYSERPITPNSNQQAPNNKKQNELQELINSQDEIRKKI